jgi:hypothetical protein
MITVQNLLPGRFFGKQAREAKRGRELLRVEGLAHKSSGTCPGSCDARRGRRASGVIRWKEWWEPARQTDIGAAAELGKFRPTDSQVRQQVSAWVDRRRRR